jgi:hypothetical protein
MHVRSDSAILLTASESPESESFFEDSDPLLSAFESDGDFAASAIQLLGHFLATGRIQQPMVTTEDDAQDSEAEEINEYAAMLRNQGVRTWQAATASVLLFDPYTLMTLAQPFPSLNVKFPSGTFYR